MPRLAARCDNSSMRGFHALAHFAVWPGTTRERRKFDGTRIERKLRRDVVYCKQRCLPRRDGKLTRGMPSDLCALVCGLAFDMNSLSPEAYAVIEGRHADPFHYLGPHL